MSGTALEPIPQLLGDIRQLIEQSRQQLASAINSSLTRLYWNIGQRIHAELLGGESAAYGAQIVATVSRHLVQEYGRSFTEKNLRRMVQFAQTYPNGEIVVSLIRQLSWTDFLCSGHKKREQIELLESGASGIHVADYLTVLRPKDVLQAKLHEAVTLSRARLESRSGEGP